MKGSTSVNRSFCKEASISFVFQKMYSPQGELVAVECLSRINHGSLSPESFFRHADTTLREYIFMEQLALIEKHQNWFIKNNIIATVNVDDDTLSLLRQSAVRERTEQLGFIHFEVKENSSVLLDNSSFNGNELPQLSTLWLDDFGSGYAGLNAIRHYHFDYIKIDRHFLLYLMRKDSGRQLMDALVTFLAKNNHKVIIEGVESLAHKRWLHGMDWYAIQGHYWEEVSIDQLTQNDISA
ncbi:TPA: EAL domain-containing protein [Klebsiella pneumoniae]|nr:EAL domain-containing protein [Klebsiella pneumoniae]